MLAFLLTLRPTPWQTWSTLSVCVGASLLVPICAYSQLQFSCEQMITSIFLVPFGKAKYNISVKRYVFMFRLATTFTLCMIGHSSDADDRTGLRQWCAGRPSSLPAWCANFSRSWKRRPHALISLHWLRVPQRVGPMVYKLAVLTHKVWRGVAPLPWPGRPCQWSTWSTNTSVRQLQPSCSTTSYFWQPSLCGGCSSYLESILMLFIEISAV